MCQKPSDDKVRWNSIGVSQWNSTLGVFLGLELCTSCRHCIFYSIINFGPQPQWWAWHMSTKGNWRVHNSLEVITTQKCSNYFENDTKKWDIGYACNNSCYKFLVIKSDILESYTIIETKNAIFFEHTFPLKNKEN